MCVPVSQNSCFLNGCLPIPHLRQVWYLENNNIAFICNRNNFNKLYASTCLKEINLLSIVLFLEENSLTIVFYALWSKSKPVSIIISTN